MSVSFNHYGTKLASGSLDSTVKVWDMTDPTAQSCLVTLNGHSDYVRSVTFNHDGTKLASGSSDQTVKVWDGSKPNGTEFNVKEGL
jgi:WD40 repeat protein